jgi:hypothetical protein
MEAVETSQRSAGQGESGLVTTPIAADTLHLLCCCCLAGTPANGHAQCLTLQFLVLTFCLFSAAALLRCCCCHTIAAAAALSQVRLLMGMLNASPWRYYPLTLQFLVPEHSTLPRGESGGWVAAAGCRDSATLDLAAYPCLASGTICWIVCN